MTFFIIVRNSLTYLKLWANYLNMEPEEIFHIEKNQDNYKIYNSLVIDHKNLGVLSNGISMKIINDMSKGPLCAMDVVRNLGIDKQKVYYYLKKLEDSGIIRFVRNEQRHGMVAKVYETVAPVISTKLYEDFGEGKIDENIEQFEDNHFTRFFYPFLNGGGLDAKVIFGDPYPHGKYDSGSISSVHAFEFFLLLGKYLNDDIVQYHKLDTETRETDLNDNLIIIGSPKGNTITEKLNSMNLLPVYFDHDNEWSIVSKITGKRYNDARTAVILKWDNPINKNKKILLLAGIRTRGMRAASIAITKHMDKILNGVKDNGNFLRIVEGMDRDGDMVIDSVKFLE